MENGEGIYPGHVIFDVIAQEPATCGDCFLLLPSGTGLGSRGTQIT